MEYMHIQKLRYGIGHRMNGKRKKRMKKEKISIK
jgi:hypothetical protein